MEPFPCPNMDMETLCSLSELPDAPRPAVQVAVWAIANNPTYTRVRRYVREAARDSEGRLSVDSIMTGAARLLEATGLEPSEFRMYNRGPVRRVSNSVSCLGSSHGRVVPVTGRSAVQGIAANGTPSPA